MTASRTKEPAVGIGVLDQVVVSATSFVATLALARACPAGELGIFVLARSVLLAVGWIQGALITTPLTVIGAPLDAAAWGRLAGALGAVQIRLSVGAALCVGIAAAVLAGAGSPISTRLAVATACSLPWLQLHEYLRRCLLARRLVAYALSVDLAHAACVLAGLAASRDLDATRLLWLQALGSAVACGLGLRLSGGWPSAGPGWPAEARATWPVGRPSLVNALASLATVQGSQWVVALAGGAAPLGMQESARLLLAPLGLAAQGAMNALVPHAARSVARDGRPALAEFGRASGRWWCVATLGVGAVFALAPETWLRAIVASPGARGVTLVRLWAAAYVASTLALWPALLLSALRRQDLLAHTSILAGAATVLTTAIVARCAEPELSIAGQLFGGLTSLALLWRHARRELGP